MFNDGISKLASGNVKDGISVFVEDHNLVNLAGLSKLWLEVHAAKQVWSVKFVGRRFHLTHIPRRLIIPPIFLRPTALGLDPSHGTGNHLV